MRRGREDRERRGNGGSVLLTRALATIAFGVAAADPFALGGAARLPLLTVVAASWAPARRAARRLDTQPLLRPCSRLCRLRVPACPWICSCTRG